MKLSKSAFYAWKARPAKLITAKELQLYRRTKELFNASRQSLGSREMAKKLRSEGFEVTRYRTMKVMAKLKLQAKQRMATSLISRAMIMAYNLRKPPQGLVLHSDRGAQYTSKPYRKLMAGYGIRSSMGDVGACWDNAVVERFFGSLKHDWIFKVHQL